jgi:putative two-component system response regulator
VTAGAGDHGTVLIVDDESGNIEVLTRVMTHDGYHTVSAANGVEALEAVSREHPDVVLLDVRMPVLDGIEACRRIKQDLATRLLPVILVTGYAEAQDRLRGIEAGADDFLFKPYLFDELRARVRSLRRMKRYTDELESAEAVIISLAMTIEARDPATQGHCQRLSRYAVTLGAALGVDDEQRRALSLGGFLHDLGKIGVPDAVLLKPGPLDPGELVQMRRHPVIGDELCGNLRSLQAVRPIVRHHHERPDGTGYPDQLRANEIPRLAAIVGVVDAYDAMTTVRPYKRALTAEAACRELREEARRGWKHLEIVEAFLDLQRDGAFDHYGEA